MRSRVVAASGSLVGALTLAAVVTLRAQAPQPPRPQVTPPPSPPQPVVAVKAPIYVLLQTTVDDVINTPASMDRLPRALKVMEGLQDRAAAYHPVCLVQFNGVAANRLGGENDSTHVVDTVKDYARRGLVEIGYDGIEEPTILARPQPNLRGADTPEKRWLARLQANEWFLTEWKQPVTGESDPSRTGGLKRVLEVFGRVDFARGATFEPWYAAELVHALDAMGSRPALVGFLENTAYPARNFDGYRGGAPGSGAKFAADERCAPEVFWLDTALRVSDYGAFGARVFNAYEGPEALAKLIQGLDRSNLHVVQVRLGHPAVYMKPGFGARNYQTPLEHAYDNPKAPNLPPAARRTPEERAAMYAQEDAVLDWLVGTFFPENAGSRFVSIGQLRSQAEAGLSDPVTRAELQQSAKQLVDRTDAALGQVPPFVQAGRRYFSLADMFGLLTDAMGSAAAPGAWPPSSKVVPLFGPLDIDQAKQVTGARISVAALMRESARLRGILTAGASTPVPRNLVPSTVTVGGVRLTAAQFLRAVAEAYVAAPGTTEVEVKWTEGNNAFGTNFPRTRPLAERGGTWTAKPAPIRFAK
jgi:hypothetical protein